MLGTSESTKGFGEDPIFFPMSMEEAALKKVDSIVLRLDQCDLLMLLDVNNRDVQVLCIANLLQSHVQNNAQYTRSPSGLSLHLDSFDPVGMHMDLVTTKLDS